MAHRTCSVADCQRPHLAKGMCKKHYYRGRGDQRLPSPPRACAVCGGEYRSRSGKTGLCQACAADKVAQGNRERAAQRKAEAAARRMAERSAPIVLREILCGGCRLPFWTSRAGVRKFCTSECSARAAGYRHRTCRNCGCGLGRLSLKTFCDDCLASRLRARRKLNKAKRRAALLAGECVDPMEVYDGCGWVCGLCGEAVDRSLEFPHIQSATLDHIVPLSLGGQHVRANLHLAHNGCNITKGGANRRQGVGASA